MAPNASTVSEKEDRLQKKRGIIHPMEKRDRHVSERGEEPPVTGDQKGAQATTERGERKKVRLREKKNNQIGKNSASRRKKKTKKGG